jgi:hypothetical protein
MSSVQHADGHQCHLCHADCHRHCWPRRETHLLHFYHEHAAVTRSPPHIRHQRHNSPMTRHHVSHRCRNSPVTRLHGCRRCRNSPVTHLHIRRHRWRNSPVSHLHVVVDDAPCRRLAHGRRSRHGNGLRTLAITSLPPVTQLTGQHAVLPRVTQLDDDGDSDLERTRLWYQLLELQHAAPFFYLPLSTISLVSSHFVPLKNTHAHTHIREEKAASFADAYPSLVNTRATFC